MTDKRFPLKGYHLDMATGESTEMLTYDQSGLIWQAEEVSLHGKRQRYYGFIGRNVICKIPAEEVELPGGWSWRLLGAGVEGQIVITGKDGKPGPFAASEPLTVAIRLRNCRGVENHLPVSLGDPVLAGTVVLRQRLPAQRDEKTTELATLSTSAFSALTGTPRQKTVAPAEELTVATFPLTQLGFKLAPSRYYLELRISAGELKGSVDGDFEVK